MYYYHYDGLGSVVALSDAAGDTVQLYEYSVYGQVAASDPNHSNPFLFTGRRFDTDTGLYYYRARYYNPYIGRFLQTDPIGYTDGMNSYAYCGNNALNQVDPLGRKTAPWLSPGYYREWMFCTGRVLILPRMLNPGILRACEGFATWMESWSKLPTGMPGLPDPLKDTVKNYMKAAAKLAGLVDDIGALNKIGWRTFLEYEFVVVSVDEDGVVHRDRFPMGWREITGLQGWIEESDRGKGFYDTWDDAVRAAQTAFQFYAKYHNWRTLGMKEQPQPPLDWFHDGCRCEMYWSNYWYTGPALYLWDVFDVETGEPVPSTDV